MRYYRGRERVEPRIDGKGIWKCVHSVELLWEVGLYTATTYIYRWKVHGGLFYKNSSNIGAINEVKDYIGGRAAADSVLE